MHKIETIRISVSETCFFKCKTCFFWKNQKKIESIDLDVYDKFFSSIAKIKGQKTYVHISGGEPLLIKNIFSFISLLKKHGLYTKINTNGWLLNKRNIEMLFDAGIDEITLSLDGSCPEIHDYIRGMPGSFNKVIKGIKEINDYSVKTKKKVEIHITTTVCSLNFDDIISIVNLIQKLNYVESIWLQAISAPFFAEFFLDSSYNPKKWYEYKQFQELWPTNKKNY